MLARISIHIAIFFATSNIRDINVEIDDVLFNQRERCINLD